jgi:hypothetical protein
VGAAICHFGDDVFDSSFPFFHDRWGSFVGGNCDVFCVIAGTRSLLWRFKICVRTVRITRMLTKTKNVVGR